MARTAIITLVLTVVPRCAPVYINRVYVVVARKGASAILGLSSVETIVFQKSTVGAGIMENTMR